MDEKFSNLKLRMARITDLYRASAVLNWDQETQMPPGGAEDRAEQISTLRGLAHRLFTDEEIGALLDDLKPWAEDLDYDSDEASMIRIWSRDYEKSTKVPVTWVEENARITTLAHHTWVEAKETENFNVFKDDLQHIIHLQHQWAEYFVPSDDIYDPLLDKFERGLTYAFINNVFSELKPYLIELTRRITEEGNPVDDSVLHRPLDAEKQITFGRLLSARLGYDYRRGRIDQSTHPFTTRFGIGDVRITTAVAPDNFFRSIKSTIHEAGHAMHGQNVKPELRRTGLDSSGGTSIGESQSRFYENIIGRSRAFWQHFLPQIQAFFSPTLDDIDLEQFYRAINKVQPSLIRVTADEVTYGLHVILRFEIEHDLINGRIEVADLPDIWNTRMEQYLGIMPPSDSQGVLQDIHWSTGLFGYFPGYLLGSVFSVQLWDAMRKDHPSVEAQIEAGDFHTPLAWLHENIMQHGRKFTLPEFARRATGEDLSYQPFMDYLEEKFSEIYAL